MMAAAGDEERVRILLVDDRPDNLVALKALLQQPDYELELAGSGEDALAQILRHEFALILLDVAMPRIDGFQVASIIKEREQSKLIPIIFITASVYDMEHVFRGYTVGAVDYLRKPVDPQALRSKVAVFVELFRQRKQIERQTALLKEAEVREQHLLRTRAEQALAESESLYELTFEEVPVGIAHADADGRITRANRQLGEIFGCTGSEPLGYRVDELAVGPDAEALAKQVLKLGSGGTFYAGEYRLLRRSGAIVWVHVSLSGLRAKDAGQRRRILIVATDITARKQAELDRLQLVRELQVGIRARDDFLSIAAHELKTPVTPLRLQVGSMLRAAVKTSPMPRDVLMRKLAAIDRAVARIEHLIDRLLDVSQLSLRTISLAFEEGNLATIVELVAQRHRADAELAGSPISIVEDGPVVGKWDRRWIEEVIDALVANAIKYGAGRPIEVRVAAEGDLARLSVRDRGVGIAPEDRDRIFERFERVAPLRHYGGFGLGLWVVRRIVEAHDGRVSVSSEPGRGSVFSVELPLRPSAETEHRSRELPMLVRDSEAHA